VTSGPEPDPFSPRREEPPRDDRVSEAVPPGDLLNLELLRGFSFRCRTDCGLCCFASPRVTARDQAQLLEIVPSAEIVRRGEHRFIASRPHGGACQFLLGLRCRVHAGRPAPCREFPLDVHLGERLQATLVLSCPGLDLARLREGATHPAALAPASGLDHELLSVRGRISPDTPRRIEHARRRRRRIARQLEREGRWRTEDEVRERLRERIPLPEPSDFELEALPSVRDGLDHLPLYFDGRAGPVGLSEAIGGWELVEIRPEGGIAQSLGVLPPIEHRPPLAAEAERLLLGYLEYWLARDSLFGSVHLAMSESSSGDVAEWVEAELRTIGATVLARGSARARSRGSDLARLDVADVERGIRATDQDLLDRPSWGDRL